MGITLAIVGSIIFSEAITVGPALLRYNKLKKEGYLIKNKRKTLKLIHDDMWLVSFYPNLLVSLIPFVNMMWIISEAIASIEIKLDLQATKEELKEKNFITKSDALIKKEAKTLIKQDKFKKAKNDLGYGKMGAYDRMNDVEKLVFINNLEENIETKEQESNGYNYEKLTTEEKKEFLMELRREILKDKNVITSLEEKPKRKFKTKKKRD